MIKVIKSGVKRHVECDECHALLEYNKEDVCTVQTGFTSYRNYIVCPCCECKIEVKLFQE